MARYDRVLIDPSANELDAALQHAVLAANDKRRQRLIAWPLSGRAWIKSPSRSGFGARTAKPRRAF